MEKTFIKEWISKNSEIFKNEFPKDFLADEKLITIDMPEKQLVLGDLFFGFYQICSADGEVYFNEEEIYKAKYIVYASKLKKNKLEIPEDLNEIRAVVKKYEKYLDNIIIKIKNDLSKESIKMKEDEAVRQIFNIMNLIRF
jgi:hypothetical protein